MTEPAIVDTELETGIAYGDGEPVPIRLRKRGHFFHLDDGGATIAKSGRPEGWLEVAERVVAQEGMNVNRAGVLFVAFGEGRDVDELARRLAESCLDVHAALLDLDGP